MKNIKTKILPANNYSQSLPKPKRVAVSYYDKLNLGDDLLVEILTRRYINSFVSTRKIHNETLKRLLRKWNIYLRIVKYKTDLLVIVGGSLFIEPDSLASWHKQVAFYEHYSKPIYIIGSNTGPIKTNSFKNIVRKIFRAAHDVCLRDQQSYKDFGDIAGVRASTDIAFSLNTELYTNSFKPNAVISLINPAGRFNKPTCEKYIQNIINITKKLCDSGLKVTFMSFCELEGDEEITKTIINRIPKQYQGSINAYYYRGNLKEAIELISTSQIVVGTRFHATILGLLFNKKVLPVIYSDKTLNVLNDIKYSGPVMDMRNLDEFDIETFEPTKLKVFNVDKQIKLANTQFQELDKVLIKRDLNE